jgi:uncharacterized protein
MALQDPQAEPSMEEILASIRRIISEEDEAPGAADEPVLDLTQPAAAAHDAHDDIVFESDPEPAPAPPVVKAAQQPAPQPVAQPAPPAPAPVAAPAPSGIVSQPNASAAAVQLARLAGTLRIADTPGQTVEGVVRELLQPMLKEWLDQNLARIVEARVEAELERIARLAR